MTDRPTPETDAAATTCSPLSELIESLDAWIEDALQARKPIGLTLSRARVTITDQHDRIAEIFDALEHQNREVAKLSNDCLRALHERDEAREELEQAKQDANQHEVDCLRALHERNEARAEGQEQARLLGMSAERELKLIRERDEARHALNQMMDVCDPQKP